MFQMFSPTSSPMDSLPTPRPVSFAQSALSSRGENHPSVSQVSCGHHLISATGKNPASRRLAGPIHRCCRIDSRQIPAVIGGEDYAARAPSYLRRALLIRSTEEALTSQADVTMKGTLYYRLKWWQLL
jgi:hypothetical protein